MHLTRAVQKNRKSLLKPRKCRDVFAEIRGGNKLSSAIVKSALAPQIALTTDVLITFYAQDTEVAEELVFWKCV